MFTSYSKVSDSVFIIVHILLVRMMHQREMQVGFIKFMNKAKF